jgi:hypothetical protein
LHTAAIQNRNLITVSDYTKACHNCKEQTHYGVKILKFDSCKIKMMDKNYNKSDSKNENYGICLTVHIGRGSNPLKQFSLLLLLLLLLLKWLYSPVQTFVSLMDFSQSSLQSI